MSSRDYGVDDYGLILDSRDLKLIASKYFADYAEEEYENDPLSFIDELVYGLDITYASDFTGEAFAIDDNGYTQWVSDSISFNCDVIYYVPANKYASLFKASYRDFSEIVKELKVKVGKYLPEDFDYRTKFRHLSGTYWSS